jgi:hypothetical protein
MGQKELVFMIFNLARNMCNMSLFLLNVKRLVILEKVMKSINKIIFFIFLMFLFNSFCFSQNNVVLDWQRIEWGISETSLVNSYAPQIKKLPKKIDYPETYVDYIIPSYLINEKSYNVEFQMSKKTEKLIGILIKHTMKNSVSSEEPFSKIEELFIQRYGNPNLSEKTENNTIISHQKLWYLDNNLVQISYIWKRHSRELKFSINFFPRGILLSSEKDSVIEYSSGSGSGSGLGIGSGSGSMRNPEPKELGFGAMEADRRKQESSPPIIKKVTITYIPRAEYTRTAKKNNITGVVKLSITFLKSGKIGPTMRVESGLPDGLIEQAKKAARGIRFKPAEENGVPIHMIKTIEFPFQLSN